MGKCQLLFLNTSFQQNFCIFKWPLLSYSMLVREVFMNSSYFIPYQIVKRIKPSKEDSYLTKEDIQAMVLPYMVEFMPENLLAGVAIQGDPIIPEYRSEKRKGCSFFPGMINFDIIQSLSCIGFTHPVNPSKRDT